MGPMGMSSPPGQSLLVFPHPGPSFQPQGFAKMVSHSPPCCLPLCHLPWAATERVTKGACLRPAHAPGSPSPRAVVQMPQVSRENLALTHLPALPPGPVRCPICTTARLFYQDPFTQRSPHHCPPLHDQKLSTPKLQEFLLFFLIKNVAYAPCEPVRCTQENNEEKQALAVSAPREQLLSSGQMSCLLSLKNTHTCSAYTIQYCSYFYRL